MVIEDYNSTNRKEENSRFAFSFLPGLLFVMLLWLIRLLTYLTDANLSWLGIFPRNFFGLIGVVTGPLIHADILHLLSNSFPFVLLSGFILFQHKRKGIDVLLFVYVLSGILTWFIGRQAYHVGASGVIYAMAAYLLFTGFIGRDRASLAISLAVLFLYSGLFYGLFPGEERISWEGHIAGFLAGFIAALTFDSRAAGARKKLAEDALLLTPEQRHTSHTLGAPYNYYHVQYTLSKELGPVTFNYTISSDNKVQVHPTMATGYSSKLPVQLNRSNDQRYPDQKQEHGPTGKAE